MKNKIASFVFVLIQSVLLRFWYMIKLFDNLARTCVIFLGSMKAGNGEAIFTAECSHSFHFSCIGNSIKHGNHLCPICRCKWKEIPFQFPNAGRSRVSPYHAALEDPVNFSPPLLIISPTRPQHVQFSMMSLFQTSAWIIPPNLPRRISS
ncbi:hypothetical protein RND71_034435 [Anisodus tanguticus]|uniref:RING-type domain-containing protein n=1 Tax=Anisodus tanguticus TaxID=243964 RepID=A0AAE1RBD9_9SOLA|nr:hypothetical protein RND71_034435 [Anisodus tanguticus]